jgi:hypothetical protein
MVLSNPFLIVFLALARVISYAPCEMLQTVALLTDDLRAILYINEIFIEKPKSVNVLNICCITVTGHQIG